MRTKHVLLVLAIIGFMACNKSETASQISLTPSATTVRIGDTLSVALTAKANASNWTVDPAFMVTKTYGVTTSKMNYFTFSQAGVYTVAVKVRDVIYNSALNQSLDSLWSLGNSRSNCKDEKDEIDTASVKIIVTGK